MNFGQPGFRSLKPNQTWRIDWDLAPKGLVSTVILDGGHKEYPDLANGGRWIRATNATSDMTPQFDSWPGMLGAESNGVNQFLELNFNNTFVDYTTAECSVGMIFRPTEQGGNQGWWGHGTAGGKHVIWTNIAANTIEYQAILTGGKQAGIIDSELFDGRVVGVIAVYDGSNVLLYYKKYTGDTSVNKVTGSAASGNLPSGGVPMTLGAYEDNAARCCGSVFHLFWSANKAITDEQAQLYLDEPYHWFKPPWESALMALSVPSVVATKNYYSGGSVAAQRLNRGIGWVQ